MTRLLKPVKFALIASLWLLFMGATSQSAEIKGVRFTDTVTIGQETLELRGMAILKWAMLFDVYAGAFYLPVDHEGDSWSDDVPKQLELNYFREIAAKDFAVSSDQLLRNTLSAEDYNHIEVRLQALYKFFQNVKPGDRYSLVYNPETGTELRFNNESQGTIPGQDFAFAYFGIWLGEKPINKKFRDRLLGEEE